MTDGGLEPKPSAPVASQHTTVQPSPTGETSVRLWPHQRRLLRLGRKIVSESHTAVQEHSFTAAPSKCHKVVQSNLYNLWTALLPPCRSWAAT